MLQLTTPACVAFVPHLAPLRHHALAATARPAWVPHMVIGEPAVAAASSLLAFADQADNLAGPLFANSLFPYLAFLYFVRYENNGLSETAKNGFTSLLVFVFLTVVCSIVGVKTFGLNLANVDWLHADAEQFLTLTNIVEVVGLKLTLDAFLQGNGATPKPPAVPLIPVCAGIGVGAAAITFAASGFDLGDHSAYLGGFGNLPDGLWTLGAAEPDNALSLPTWVIHISSLLEWLVAMGLVWRIGIASGNRKWQGLTWAMIPSHSSGICACVYHLFYNAPSVGYVVILQAALTFLGNTTLAFAAYRLAASNGWTLKGALPAALQGDTPPEAPPPPALQPGTTQPLDDLALPTILLLTVVGSYLIKYGETLLPFVFANDLVAPSACRRARFLPCRRLPCPVSCKVAMPSSNSSHTRCRVCVACRSRRRSAHRRPHFSQCV